jgi:hypothetical protein
MQWAIDFKISSVRYVLKKLKKVSVFKLQVAMWVHS